MAKTMNEPVAQTQIVQSAKKKFKMNGVVFNLLAVLTAIIIMIVVFGGAFYVVIHNNINGLGEKYRNNLQGIPVLKLALPAVKDPEDPKYLTDGEIKSKYNELRKTKDELTNKLNEMTKEVQGLQTSKSESDAQKAQTDKSQKDLQSQVDQQKKQIDQDKTTIDQLTAQLNAKNEQTVSTDAKKFSQLYETMDASAAAKIFAQMGDSKLQLIVDILKNMKKESSADILAAMDPAFASKVSQKLSEVYMKPSAN